MAELIMEYFQEHPNEDIPHDPVVDAVVAQYIALYGKPHRDPWRAIRELSQEGKLVKVKKGVYRYDPEHAKEVQLFDFSEQVKEEIFKRDNYKCVVCGRGRADGIEICADHVKPRAFGGDNSIDNGQTLCTPHNLQKRNYSQTESRTGKQVWHYVLAEPFTWLFYCFFQPTYFRTRYEQQGFLRRVVLMFRLILPLFLLSYPFAVALQALLSGCFLSCKSNMLLFMFQTTALGVGCGMVAGVLGDVGLDIALSIALGITGIVVGNLDMGLTRGISVAVIIGLLGGIGKG